MSSWKTPTDQQIKAAVQRLRSPDFEAYFLARLQNPNWIAPLREQGVFRTPPAPVVTDGGGVSYPVWQASKYLVRMAPHRPQEVADVLVELETDNPFIISDFVEAALAMPVQEATALVPAVAKGVHSRGSWFGLKEVGTLCKRFAKGGEIDAALALAESMFSPVLEEEAARRGGRDDHWYFEALDDILPALVEACPKDFLARLFKWLDLAIGLRDHADRESGEDYSFMWRQAIEEHAQNSEFDFASNVVSRVREAAELAVREDLLSFEDVLARLEEEPFFVFRRLRVHLINTFAERDPPLARRLMMDRSFFDDHWFKHEYAMLVGKRFELLSTDERELWYSWIDLGPDPADSRGEEEEDRADQEEYWRYSRYHWVREHLRGDRRRFYEEMLTRHGEPTLADLHMYSSAGSWGSISPVTLDELAAGSFAEAVERVASWRPAELKWLGPDVEGLSSTFREYVGSAASRFSEQARVLEGRPAIYVRVFLSQMSEAVKGSTDIAIDPVLDLCAWVLGRPREERTTPQGGHDVLVDKDWQWTRDEVSRLVENLCRAREGDAPQYPMTALRERVWSLIETLYTDPSDSYILSEDSQEDPRATDYLDRGINSSRGKAVEAGLEYARWVANHVKTEENGQDVVPGGFDAMPEVRDMLDWQLEPDNRSVEALAIIGLHLGLVFWIDRDWLAANADHLFDLGEEGGSPPLPEGWAAWNSFLVWVRPHAEYLRIFKRHYTNALRQSGEVTSGATSRRNPMASLGQHVVILYGRGDISLEEEASLICSLLKEAPSELRRDTMGFVGRVLWREEDLPAEMIERFIAAWEFYWEGAGPNDAAEAPEEWLFGAWFASTQLPVDWALHQLASFVEVVPIPEPDHAVVERLAAVAPHDVEVAVAVLAQMVRGDREGWHIHSWRSSARDVLVLALKADGAARTQAEQTVDHLARRGYPNFMDDVRVS